MASARSRLQLQGSPSRLGAWLLCAGLLVAGCAAGHPESAAPPKPPHSASHASSSPTPTSSPSTSPSRKVLAAEYLAIATPANRQLDEEVDSYSDNEHDNLAVSKADLRKEAATEQLFDERLLKIAFPPSIAAVSAALVGANNQRIALTRLQSRAATIGELVAFDKRHKGADAAVEVQVRYIRRDLGLPPPETS